MPQVVQTEGPRTRPVVRHLRPTDLVALAAFEAKDLPNEARTRDCIDRDRRRPFAIATVLEQWLAAEDRQTLVAGGGLAIRGLVSARQRSGRSAWEVDWLLLDGDKSDDRTLRGPQDGASLALLERLAEEAVRLQVQRIFLRVPKESEVVGAAARAGFVAYGTEALLRRGPSDLVLPTDESPSLELRPRGKEDELAVFRLYHGAVPPQVRSMEGMTLEEWRATRDVQFGQQREFVWCEEDRVRAWLQVNRSSGCGQFRLLLHPEDEGRVKELVAYALGQLSRRDPALALVPHYQPSLRSVLKEVWGFEEVAEYETLVRQLAVRVPEARFVPARA